MSNIYKPTAFLNSTVHDEPDTDSASLFAQGYDNSILSLVKNADVLSETCKACCPIRDFTKELQPKSTCFCNCRVDPDFENFRNTVLRLLTNVQEDIQGYIQAGISLRKQEYVTLVEIRDRIDRCQRDIMLFIDTFSGEYMPRLRRQSSILETRNAKLQTRAKNLLVNELDADKYLSTERKREKSLLEADNLALKEELREIKTKYELQLVRTQNLLDKMLDCIQIDNVPKPRPVSSYSRTSSTISKKSIKGGLGINQTKMSITSKQTLQDIKKQLLELKNDTADLQVLVKKDKCGPICPHEQALHILLKETKREPATLHLSKEPTTENTETRISSNIMTTTQTMTKIFEPTLYPPATNSDNSLQIENIALKKELTNQKERTQTLERENVALLKELSDTKQNLDRIQKNAPSLNNSSVKQHDDYQCYTTCGTIATTLNVSTLLHERNVLCQKLQKKDVELTKLQAEIDEVMSELITLNERYDELEKSSLPNKSQGDSDSIQCPWKLQEKHTCKDVVSNNESKLHSKSVVDLSTLYSNSKGTIL